MPGTNTQLSGWLLGLDRELLYQQTPSSFPSVALTVQHMQESQQFWMGIIARKGIAVPDEPDAAVLCLNLLSAGSKLMLDTFTAYTEEALLEPISSTNMVQPRYAFILHAINHVTYHRGQIVTMCRQLGVVDNIPTMDYEVFLWYLTQ